MKLALHRSITFWSGLFVMSFIVWAWRDSMTHLAAAGWNSLHAGSYGSLVVVGSLGGGLPGGGDFQVNRETMNFADRNMVAPVIARPAFATGGELDPARRDYTESVVLTVTDQLVREMMWRPKGCWRLLLPYWLVLLLFASGWVGLLVWRARRRERRMPNAEFPNEE